MILHNPKSSIMVMNDSFVTLCFFISEKTFTQRSFIQFMFNFNLFLIYFCSDRHRKHSISSIDKKPHIVEEKEPPVMVSVNISFVRDVNLWKTSLRTFFISTSTFFFSNFAAILLFSVICNFFLSKNVQKVAWCK